MTPTSRRLGTAAQTVINGQRIVAMNALRAMPRFAKELPPWTKKFLTEASISIADAEQLRTEIDRIGDRYLATAYAELPTHARMSILADAFETAIISRYLDEHLMVPPLVIDDEEESVAVGAI